MSTLITFSSQNFRLTTDLRVITALFFIIYPLRQLTLDAENPLETNTTGTEGNHYDAPLAFDLEDHWFQDWQHNRFSRNKTPFVHTLNLEPALVERDLSFNARYAEAQEDEEELEFEVELEWAFTRRIGVVFELPFRNLNPKDEDSTTGIADIVLGPRLLTVETERYLLTSNLEFTLPSGDDDRSLGSGELALHPSLSIWADLGHWFTMGGQVGYIHGTESGDSEFRYRTALTYSFLTTGSKTNFDTTEFPRGLSSLIFELEGRTTVEGINRGTHRANVIYGISHNLNPHWELRAGYQAPIGGPQDFDDAVIFSMIHHF